MHCTSVHSSSLILLTESCMRLGCHKQIFTTKCRNQDKLYLILGFWSFTYVKSQNQRGWGGICYFYLGIEGNCIEGQLLSYRLFLGGMSFPKRPVDWVENEEGVASYESFMAASWDLNFHQGVQTVKPTTFFSLDSPSLILWNEIIIQLNCSIDTLNQITCSCIMNVLTLPQLPEKCHPEDQVYWLTSDLNWS